MLVKGKFAAVEKLASALQKEYKDLHVVACNGNPVRIYEGTKFKRVK